MSRHSTKTVGAGGAMVPWLAASGPLAYTPETPPDRDYYFQYGWVMPEVLSPGRGRRQHHYFGAGRRDFADEVFRFWTNARAGFRTQIYAKHGSFSEGDITAPIAVYLHKNPILQREWYMLIQHGSYLYVPCEDQPEMDDGIVYLYRGIQAAPVFRYLGFDAEQLGPTEASLWQAFLQTQAEILSDSVASFNSIHDRTVRCETGGINDRTLVSDGIAKRNGLDIDDGGFGERLWANHQQCFSLSGWVAAQKFGPNFVAVKTPLTNIRITTFFAGEMEAKVIDPKKAKLVRTVGCEWSLGN
jgi:hypothetical protein